MKLKTQQGLLEIIEDEVWLNGSVIGKGVIAYMPPEIYGNHSNIHLSSIPSEGKMLVVYSEDGTPVYASSPIEGMIEP